MPRIDVWDLERFAVTLDCGLPRGRQNHYSWGKELGKGGFGEVKVVTHIKSGRQYACKCIAKELQLPNVSPIKRQQHLDNIKREVAILRKLRGTLNVVHLEDAFEDDTHVYIVMEWCKGGELIHAIGKRHYSERTVASFMRAVLRTLAQCHAHRILHRDIKPGNFMLLNESERCPVKAIDFGLAVFFDPQQVPRTDLGLEGTPWYMAPEVLSSETYPQSDVWAAGVMAFQLLSGKFPFDDWKNQRAPALSLVWRSILTEDPNFKRSGWEDISDQAKDFVRSLLTKDPRARPDAKQALQHPWLQGNSQQRSKGKPLSATIVQKLQRFGQVNVFKRTVLDMIANEVLAKRAEAMMKEGSWHGGSVHGSVHSSIHGSIHGPSSVRCPISLNRALAAQTSGEPPPDDAGTANIIPTATDGCPEKPNPENLSPELQLNWSVHGAADSDHKNVQRRLFNWNPLRAKEANLLRMAEAEAVKGTSWSVHGPAEVDGKKMQHRVQSWAHLSKLLLDQEGRQEPPASWSVHGGTAYKGPVKNPGAMANADLHYLAQSLAYRRLGQKRALNLQLASTKGLPLPTQDQLQLSPELRARLEALTYQSDPPASPQKTPGVSAGGSPPGSSSQPDISLMYWVAKKQREEQQKVARLALDTSGHGNRDYQRRLDEVNGVISVGSCRDLSRVSVMPSDFASPSPDGMSNDSDSEPSSSLVQRIGKAVKSVFKGKKDQQAGLQRSSSSLGLKSISFTRSLSKGSLSRVSLSKTVSKSLSNLSHPGATSTGGASSTSESKPGTPNAAAGIQEAPSPLLGGLQTDGEEAAVGQKVASRQNGALNGGLSGTLNGGLSGTLGGRQNGASSAAGVGGAAGEDAVQLTRRESVEAEECGRRGHNRYAALMQKQGSTLPVVGAGGGGAESGRDNIRQKHGSALPVVDAEGSGAEIGRDGNGQQGDGQEAQVPVAMDVDKPRTDHVTGGLAAALAVESMATGPFNSLPRAVKGMMLPVLDVRLSGIPESGTFRGQLPDKAGSEGTLSQRPSVDLNTVDIPPLLALLGSPTSRRNSPSSEAASPSGLVPLLNSQGSRGRSKGLQQSQEGALAKLISDPVTREETDKLLTQLTFNADGKTSREQFENVLSDMGYVLEDSEMEALMSVMNNGNASDNTLSRAAFIASQVDWADFQANYCSEWLECLQNAFEGLDTDKDGRIGKQELVMLLADRLPEDEVNAAVEDALVEVAAEEEGLDFEGFMAMLRINSSDSLHNLDQYDSRNVKWGSVHGGDLLRPLQEEA